jgi:hypothetical protein
VMTGREVSAYLQVHPSTILQAAEASSDSGVSCGQRLALQHRGDRPLAVSASVNTGFRGGWNLVWCAAEMLLKALACLGTPTACVCLSRSFAEVDPPH